MAQRVALELNKDNFKLCCVDQVKNAKRVLQLIKKEFDATTSDSDIAELIKNTLQGLKIKSESISCILPRHKTTVRLIKLPSINKDELQGMVDIQTARLIPYSKEETIYNYQVIAEENGEYSWVRVGIAHQDVINRFLNIANLAGLSVESLCLSTDTCLSWLVITEGINEQAQVLANIDRSSLDVSIVYRGLTIFSRSVSFENSLINAQAVLEEIKKTILGFNKEELFLNNADKFKIDKIILMGIKTISEEIKPQLANDLSIQVNLAGFGALEEASDELKDEYAKVSYSNVLGILMSDRIMINFVPSHVTRQFKASVNKKHFIYIGLLLSGILVISASIVYKKIQDKTKLISHLEGQIKNEDSLAKNVRIAKSRLEAIKQWNKDKKLCIDIVRELYRITPGEISLTVLTYDINTPLVLQGSAQKMSDIFKFVSILEQSEYFQNVQIRYATKRKVRKFELADFQINCPFEGPK